MLPTNGYMVALLILNVFLTALLWSSGESGLLPMTQEERCALLIVTGLFTSIYGFLIVMQRFDSDDNNSK